MRVTFDAELWLWDARRADAWVFVSLPASESDETLTASNVVVGTPPYMAPEQLEGKECDARTDIFGLGLVLYEMASGRRAFTAESQAGLIAAILRGEPLALEGVPFGISSFRFGIRKKNSMRPLPKAGAASLYAGVSAREVREIVFSRTRGRISSSTDRSFALTAYLPVSTQ